MRTIWIVHWVCKRVWSTLELSELKSKVTKVNESCSPPTRRIWLQSYPCRQITAKQWGKNQPAQRRLPKNKSSVAEWMDTCWTWVFGTRDMKRCWGYKTCDDPITWGHARPYGDYHASSSPRLDSPLSQGAGKSPWCSSSKTMSLLVLLPGQIINHLYIHKNKCLPVYGWRNSCMDEITSVSSASGRMDWLMWADTRRPETRELLPREPFSLPVIFIFYHFQLRQRRRLVMLSHVWLFATPGTAAQKVSLSITISQ